MDRFILDHAQESAALDALRRSDPADGDPGALLCVEIYGDRAEDLPPRLEALERDLAASGFRCRWRRALTLPDQARIWSFREASLGLSMAMKGDDKSLSFVEDTAVAPEKLRDYIDRFLEDRPRPRDRRRRVRARVGRLPARAPGRQPEDRGGRARFEAIANDIADLVLEFGGALSGEHGDGLVRGPFMEKMFGPALYGAFRAVKQHVRSGRPVQPRQDRRHAAADGEPALRRRLPDAGPADVLRLRRARRHGARRRDVQRPRRVPQDARRDDVPVVHGDARGEAFDARPRQRAAAGDGGQARRVGARRRRRARGARPVPRVPRVQGRVSRRRRRRALQERVSGRLLAPARHAAGARARSATCTRCRRWAAGSRRCRTSSAQSGLGRWINEKLLRHRPPAHAARVRARDVRATLRERPRPTGDRDPPIRSSPQSAAPTRRPVQRHLHQLQPSRNRRGRGRSARGGRRRRPPRGARLLRPAADLAGAAGRSARAAQANADALFDVATRGERIVFLEPSCLSAVREDAPALLRGEAQRRARVVADACVLFEDYVEQEWQAGRIHLNLQPGPSTVLLHGHCHQKAMGLMPPARALLGRIPSCTVVDLDAGCCGMAGSFGYAREHYEVSRQIGERRLLPAARAMAPGGRARRRGRVVPAAGGAFHRRRALSTRRSCWLRCSTYGKRRARWRPQRSVTGNQEIRRMLFFKTDDDQYRAMERWTLSGRTSSRMLYFHRMRDRSDYSVRKCSLLDEARRGARATQPRGTRPDGVGTDDSAWHSSEPTCREPRLRREVVCIVRGAR